MAPAQDSETHLKFLLCCIKHTNSGKVNFDAVAQELDIVSKAAAAKRYERLLKAHQITPAAPAPEKAEGFANGTPAKTPRKRKVKAEPKNDDDDAAFKSEGEDAKPTPKKRAKKEHKMEESVTASAENGSYPAMNKMLRLCDIPWATKEMVDAAAAGKEMPVEVVTVEDDEDGDDVQVLSSSSAVSGFHGQRAVVAGTSLGFDHGNAGVFGMGDMSANAGYPSQVMMSLPSELARFQSFGDGYFQDPSMGGFHHS